MKPGIMEVTTSFPNIEALGETLCSAFCADIKPHVIDGYIAVPLPLAGRDGDGITAFLDRSAGGWRISDMGETLMRLSYEHDVNAILSGTRRELYQSILKENGVNDDDGEITVDVPVDKLISGLFSIGQAASRIGDLSFWTRTRTESTFFEDLKARMFEAVPADSISMGYVVDGIPEPESYPVDFYVSGGPRPLYVFGVNNQERARLATITIQHLRAYSGSFDAVAALSKLDDVPKRDLNRLMYAANDTIPSIDDSKSFADKLRRHLAAS